MSWLFSFLLICYVAVRLVLRVRGRLRWLAVRETLPEPPPMVAAPEHLSPSLAELFVDSRALRAELVLARRELTAVAVQDPDAPLGQVRDSRYRRAVMDSFSRVNAWLRAVDALDPASAGELVDLHVDPSTIAGLRDGLRDKWRAVARARALDPFDLDDLRAVEQTLARVELELAAIERSLAQLGEHPYRHRHGHPSELVSQAVATA